ncbi:MAG: hypothetical protein ACLS3C_06855 [Oscillospiraceae bacterium]
MLGLDFVTEKVAARMQKLKVISRYGVGYDRMDVAAAKALGIAVTNTPGVNSEAVAEPTMGADSVARPSHPLSGSADQV